MKQIRLPETGLEVDVPDNFYYHDDGLVPSLLAHSSELYEKYGSNANPIKKYQVIIDSMIFTHLYKRWAHDHQHGFIKGRFLISNISYNSIEDAFENDGEVHAHTYVMDLFEPEETSFFRGHEETHVLITIDKLDVLINALTGYGIKNCESLVELDEEAICQIGGFYAHLRNHPNTKYPRLKGVVDSSFPQWSAWLSENSTWKFY